MIDELEKALSLFDVTLSDVSSKLKLIGKEGYVRKFNSRERPTIHYNHCYFAMASLLLKDVRNILEIGTGPGRSTVVFAKLFPEATVYTVDIPKGDPEYQKSWASRGNSIRGEIANNLNQPNIKSYKVNSFFLPTLTLPNQFEIIYVDGGHEYPVVAWDIMFSYHRLSRGGFLFMHDYNAVTRELPAVKEMVHWIDIRVKEKVFFLPEYADPAYAGKKMVCLVKGKEG